jgi:cyclic pyranopterin phosphate synthase
MRSEVAENPASLTGSGATEPLPLADRFGRRLTYLRLSVTDRCDLRCAYCMPEAMRFAPRRDLLELEELEQLAAAFIARGVTKIRLTGGEPLVRKGVLQLVESLGGRLGRGLEELALTTNGTRLAQFAEYLARAGVRRVNVSLDTRDPGLFARLTRRDRLGDVLEGLAAARAAGLAVKLNTVALRGLNEDELPSLIEWAHRQGFALTLIEAMPMGEIDADRASHYLPLTTVRAGLERRWRLVPLAKSTGGPARYVRVAETGGQLGFITPLTGNFCASCNRVRVTATGQLYPCLGGAEQVDLRAALRSGDPGSLDAALDEAMRVKPERHYFFVAPGARPTRERHMSVTGG